MKWAIIGCGWMADDFLQSLKHVDGAEVVACGSKNIDRAKALADKFDIPSYYDSYDAMLENEEIDIVYIATTHNYHYENALLCLDHGKHLLIEKPVTINTNQFEELSKIAQKKKLFLMEAMWTRFLPGITKLKQVIASGIIGDLVILNADFGNRVDVDLNNRFYNAGLAGGSMLDMGIYPLTFANLIFAEKPSQVISAAALTETGVDATATYILQYNDNAIAKLSSSITTNLGASATIYGTKGFISIDGFFGVRQFTVVPNGEDSYVIDCDYVGTGKQFEAENVMASIATGKIESDIHPHSETLWMMQLMDKLRAEWGVVYPGE